MMRFLRAVLAVCVALLSALVIGTPAQAGNWAVTVLDPLPEKIEPGRSYTIGFWVLQHGSHPYSGSLDPVALRLVEAKGKTLTFDGVALKEPAHYATAVAIPAGTWTVYGLQGVFADYQVGTLVVPGGLTVLKAPPPLKVSAEQLPWREIAPPQLAVDPNRDPFSATAVEGAAQPGAAQPEPRAAQRPIEDQPLPPVGMVVLAVGLPLMVLGLLVTRRSWWPRVAVHLPYSGKRGESSGR